MFPSSDWRNTKTILSEGVDEWLERNPKHPLDQLMRVRRFRERGAPDKTNSSQWTICSPGCCNSSMQVGEERPLLEPKAVSRR
jgi:hypothetical protein